jgi:hypothetical protein
MQDQSVCYRLDFDKQGNFDPEDKYRSYRQEKILSGYQIPIGGDLHKAQLTSIIDQLKVNGMCKFDEVSKTKSFTVPYIYREDAEVPNEAIRRQRDINNGVHTKQGSDRRKAAAVGVSQAVLDASSIIAPKGVSIEFEQTKQSDMGERRIEEGVKVNFDSNDKGPRNKIGARR